MWFRLAAQLGMSVAQAQQEVSSAEFNEWMAYYRIEPWGERMADIRMGMLASVIANVNRDPKQKPYKPGDFMPWVTRAAKRINPGKPVKLKDKRAQANLVAAAVLGVDLESLRGRRRVTLRRQADGKFKPVV